MPVTASYNIPQESKNITFGRTIIDWNKQRLVFQMGSVSYTHDLTEAQWDYLSSGLQSIMEGIPNVSNLAISNFDANINSR